MKNRIFQIMLLLFLLSLLGGWIFWMRLSFQIDEVIQSGWFPPSLEYYSSPMKIKKHQVSTLHQLQKELRQRQYIHQKFLKKLKQGEFIILNHQQCYEWTSQKFDRCLYWIQKISPYKKYIVGFKNRQISFFQGSSFKEVSSIELDPVLFAQYEGEFLRMRKKFKLNQVPYACLQSITMIEDQNFITHKGAHWISMVRALIRNIQSTRIKEGGSTITQQLVKNRFLSFEKTFRRKWVELFMSIILERKLSKDKILELYLNTIYMGQARPYSLYGFASASHYYFQKPLIRLNHAECSLLSAIVQSPGNLNPFFHPEKSKSRRDLILNKLYQEQIISKNELTQALKFPLPDQQQKISIHKAPYFVQAVYKELKNIHLPTNQNLKIYTTIDLSMQSKIAKAIQNELPLLEKRKNITKKLQLAMVFLDLKTNQVRALLGGRNFSESQFNRAIESQRPIGSLIKPFIYFSFLKHQKKIHPLTLVQDQRIQNSSWSPKNYKNKYYGSVPLYFALSQSLNTVSAWIGNQVGLKNIIKDLKRSGLDKKIAELPSITLGAVDLSAFQVSQMYSTLARMGEYQPLVLVQRVETDSGRVIYQSISEKEKRLNSKKTAVVIGMMKQVIQSGTGQWIHPFWSDPAAGKTGTSNDERDSWFVGFTPDYLMALWVGYDDNTSHHLTGASGALPLWLHAMKSLDVHQKNDFVWPKNIEKKLVNSLMITSNSKTQGEIELLSVKENQNPSTPKIELIFESEKRKKWYELFYD